MSTLNFIVEDSRTQSLDLNQSLIWVTVILNEWPLKDMDPTTIQEQIRKIQVTSYRIVILKNPWDQKINASFYLQSLRGQ